MSHRPTYRTRFFINLKRFQQTDAAKGVTTMQTQRLTNQR